MSFALVITVSINTDDAHGYGGDVFVCVCARACVTGNFCLLDQGYRLQLPEGNILENRKGNADRPACSGCCSTLALFIP